MRFELKPLLVGLSAAVLVLLVSDWVVLHAWRGPAADFDETVRMGVHSLATPPLTMAMRILTWLGSPVPLIALALGSFCILRRRLGHGAWLPPIALGLAEALTESAKYLVRRPRPEPFFGIKPLESWSFPSGHSLDSMCFYLVLGAAMWRLRRPLWPPGRLWSSAGRRPATPPQPEGLPHPGSGTIAVMALAVAIALLIGFTRVYLGVHWPTDVLTGWAAGACAGTGLIRAADARRAKGLQ